MKDSLHYAKTKNTDINEDADGWDFGGVYEQVAGEDVLLYFDDWSDIVIRSNKADWWRGITGFQKSVLRKGGYDCTCSVEECVDRLHRTVGLPACTGSYDIKYSIKQMACSRMDNECAWKGSRSTCVNPNSGKKKKRRHY